MSTRQAGSPQHSGSAASGRLRILEAGRAEIRLRGFDRVRARGICERAGVSHPLLFYHFPSIEECLTEAVETSVAATNARFDAALDGLDDRLDRIQLLIEWHVPSSPVQRDEWLLDTEFVHAALRSPHLAEVALRHHLSWRDTVAAEFGSATPGRSPDAARLATLAEQFMALSDSLGWQVVLPARALAPDAARAILAGSVASALGIPASDLERGRAQDFDHRLARVRGLAD